MASIRTSRYGLRAAIFGCMAMLLLGAVAPMGSNLAQAQTPVPQDETGPYRFTAVEKWQGTFSYQGGGAGEQQVSQGHLTWNASHTAHGTFTMEGPTFPEPWRNVAVWEGPAEGLGSINTQITLTDHCEELRRWTGGGAMPGVLGPGDGLKPAPLRARLRIDFDEKEYNFSVSPEGIDTTEYYKLTCPNYTNESTSSFSTMLGGGGFSTGLATAKLPDTGLEIDGTVSFDDQLAQMWAISDEGGVIPWTYQWGLQPAGKADVEMVVSPEGFDRWLPEGGTAVNRGGIGVGASAPAPAANLGQAADNGVEIEFSGGNALTVTAKLQGVDGGALKQKARKFTFELLEVSDEPGIAMNAPNVKARRDLPDLEFQQIPNFAVSVRVLDSKKAETTTEGLTEARAILSANDFGAWGVLRVTAELESGQQIVGYLDGDKEQKEIRIPKRKPDSKVADYWKDLYGVGGRDDADDTENAPIGYAGCPGDGLTLYEEYRGFFENGKHMRTKPTRKDFFAVDRIGTTYSKSGISMFQGATQLEVHGDMLLTEVSDNLVVNFNHRQGPHIVDQHGVQMVSRPSPGMPGAAIKKPGYKGVGTPGTYSWIIIDSGLNPRKEPERYASIVAHELAHTVGVYEHGSGDLQRQWLAWEEDDGVVRLHEIDLNPGSTAKPVTITVKREDGSIIPATSKIFGGDDGVIVTVGVKGGQHSGVEACLMRYDSSFAYVSESDRKVRYYVQGDEERGTMLCATTVGTGVNQQNRVPQSRYGPTGPTRGDCMHQICVSDLMIVPAR